MGYCPPYQTINSDCLHSAPLLFPEGGGGGVLNRCLGREVRPGCSNPDPV